MKTLKAIFVELTLPFLMCWFFMSVLVDIVAIPTVFKNISNIQEAGKIGMIVFHRFNCIEIFFGICVSLGMIFRQKKSTALIAIALVLFGLSLVYTFYMTPMIAEAGVKVHQVALTDPLYEALQKEHTKYHTLYRNLDSVKLMTLLILSGVMLRLNIKAKELT